MSALPPPQAADIAKQVYAVKEHSDLQTAYEFGGGLGLNNQFDISPKRLDGTTGPLIFKSSNGFGYCATGKQGTSKQGQALIALRGTVTANDWLTDFNAGLQRSPFEGTAVHAGFNDTYNSFGTDVGKFLDQCKRSNIKQVHCVGHSLGGALASITAGVATTQGFNVKLYTFGCPRVGTDGFANLLTQKVGAENIYRVHFKSDPVSMLPVFPFTHVPHSSSGIQLVRSSLLINPFSHMMKNYCSALEGTEWSGLRTESRALDLQQRSKAWINASDNLPGSANDLQRISAGLKEVIAKSLKLTGAVVGGVATGAFTVLDHLAWMLTKGAAASVTLAKEVGGLLGSILKFMGKIVSATMKITMSFVKWVLSALFNSLQNAANLAMNKIFGSE